MPQRGMITQPQASAAARRRGSCLLARKAGDNRAVAMNELTSIPTTLPQSRLGWAKRNTLTPGERLTVYTPDDRAPIDNNDVEQANRPATLGRTSYRWQRSWSSRSALGKAGGGTEG